MKSEIPTYFAASTCYVAILEIVFIFGFISPTWKQLIEEEIIDKEILSVYASISSLGINLGFILMFFCLQCQINSNVLVILTSVVGASGWLMIISANSASVLISGMFLVGLSSGYTGVFSQLYIGEISLSSQRKVLGGITGFCLRISVFFVYALGIWLSFRWLAVLGLLILLLLIFLISINPLSPEWYVSQGLEERAKQTLFYLHGKDFDADAELLNIRNDLSNKQFTWIDSIKALRNWKVLKPILLMTAFAFFKEFGGHEAMVSFSSHILENQQGMDPKVASLFYPTFLTAGAIVSMIIFRFCKLKWLIIVGNVLQTLSHLSMSIYYFVSDKYFHCTDESSQICRTISFWPIMNISLYAFAFSLGWGVIYFSLTTILIVSYREISLPIVNLTCNTCMFCVINLFYFLLNTIGAFSTFLCLAMVNLTSIFFVYFSLNI